MYDQWIRFVLLSAMCANFSKKMMIAKSISNPRVLNFRMQRELDMDKKAQIPLVWMHRRIGFCFLLFFYFSFVPFWHYLYTTINMYFFYTIVFRPLCAKKNEWSQLRKADTGLNLLKWDNFLNSHLGWKRRRKLYIFLFEKLRIKISKRCDEFQLYTIFCRNALENIIGGKIEMQFSIHKHICIWK
jgi:hypothetical protein